MRQTSRSAAARHRQEARMALWQRLLVTLIMMLLTSFLAGLLWSWLFGSGIPSYLSGVVGGVTAVPVWEFLKRVDIR
jgi:hypothetical protein